jgi:hypothetical protein
LKPVFIIVGGGAAGFFCAVNAARMYPGLQVVVLEKSSKLLSKVKVSGGGRCNVTHHCNGLADLLQHYPRGASFLKRSFHHFATNDTVSWFRERGVELKTEEDGRMFPVSNSSETIIRCLLDEAARYGVDIRMNAEVAAIAVLNTDGLSSSPRFSIRLSDGRQELAHRVCVTVGGYPKQSQYHWLAALGHAIVPPVPSLFTFNIPANPITALMGVTVQDAIVKLAGTRLQQQGALLITHWGMSGPAVLKLSALAARELADRHYRFRVFVNWLPSFHENNILDEIRQLRFKLAAQKMHNRNPFGLPSRLWEHILTDTGIPVDMRWADLPSREQNKLAKQLCASEYEVSGKTTFKEEFVTAGGISLDEVDASTMQSRKHPGLYFAGEILDVDGLTGGFNFQNAWTTAWIAARSSGKDIFNESVDRSNL